MPTIVLLSAADKAPVMEQTTPGSMYGVDVQLFSSNSTMDQVYVAAAGKHVPVSPHGEVPCQRTQRICNAAPHILTALAHTVAITWPRTLV